MATTKFYYVYDDKISDTIYVTDDKQDAIKFAVEWFFGKEKNPFGDYSGSGVRSFDKSKLNARYGREILTFEFKHSEKILDLYKTVDKPDLQIIDVLQKLIDAQEASREKAEELASLEQQIKKLKVQSAKLKDEIQNAFVNPLVDASEGAERLIRKVNTSVQETEDREARKLQDLAKSGEAIFGLTKVLRFSFCPEDRKPEDEEEEDDDNDCGCLVCKAIDRHTYFVSLRVITDEYITDHYTPDVSTYAHLCCDCFAKNLSNILQEKLVLDSPKYDD